MTDMIPHTRTVVSVSPSCIVALVISLCSFTLPAHAAITSGMERVLSEVIPGVLDELVLTRSPTEVTNPSTAICIIAFGENLEGLISGIDERTNWTITGASGTVVSGNGPSLCAHVFEQPGQYVVSLQEPPHAETDECRHTRMPAQVEVRVGEVRMRFVMEGIIFTEELGSSFTEGMRMRVPMEVALYKDATAEYEVPEARSAGVGSTLVAHPVLKKVNLTNGVHVLEFSLSGSAESGSYIMFDLVDINGRTISWAYSDKIE